MSKNVIINGVTYSGISIVSLPTSSGTATFKDEGEITVPSGSLSVTDNGTYDVTNYASVVVNVSNNSELTLTGISATYSGGTVAAGTTVEQLTGITVTATYTATGYTGNITKTVTGYSLSGTLTPGQTNTITVSYSGKTATFEVTVEAESNLPTGVSRVETLTFTATAGIGQSQTIEHSWGSTPPTYIIMKRDGEASAAWAVDGYIIHNGDTNSYPRHHNATSHGPLPATQAPNAIFTENGIQINSASSANKWYDSSSANNTFTVVAVWLS